MTTISAGAISELSALVSAGRRVAKCVSIGWLLSAAPGYAQNIVAGAFDLPPYYTVGALSASSVTGCLPDMLSEIAREARFDYVLRSYPPKRLYATIASGDAQLWLGSVDAPEWQGKILTSRAPLMEATISLYRRSDAPEVISAQQLSGKTVIMVHGYAHGEFDKALRDPASGVRIQHADNFRSALQMLANGRGDYLLAFARPIEQAMKNFAFALKETRVGSAPLYVVVPKAYAEGEALLKKIELAIGSLKAQGRFARYAGCIDYVG